MHDPSHLPLFGPSDRIDRDALVREQQAIIDGRLAPRPDLDSASMWTSRNDGLLTRGIKPHSHEKAEKVSRGIDTVSFAMGPKWFDVQYGEMYCGPGVLTDETTGEEIAGSPLQALAVRRPFDLYVFGDYDEGCIEALRPRVARHPQVRLETGSANDPAHIARFCAHFDPRALVVIYLDPARPQDLHWATVEALARRFEQLDLIINLPVNSLARAITGPEARGFEGRTAGRFLNHPNPSALIQRDLRGGLAWDATIDAIRHHYDQQLERLGFLTPARRTVTFPDPSPYYDVLYASRHPMGLKLWNSTNPPPENPQMSLDIAA